MIRLFLGTPGAGKSYGALKEVVLELLYSQRIVITNLPVLPGLLNAWMAKNHPEWTDDINQRVRIIGEDQTKEFYRYRSVIGDIGTVTKGDALEGKHLPYGEHKGNGVFYIIDEAHIPFDSREWASTGTELTFYNSQHRKMNDELIFVTQFEKLIDVRVRGFVQEFWYFNNDGLEAFWTYFQKPAGFTVEVHRKPPSGPHSPPPLERRKTRMDFTLAACYDTSAGVGITGRKMPEVKRKKKFAVWWLAIPVLLLGFMFLKAPDVLTSGIAYLLGNGVKTQKTDQTKGGAQASLPLNSGSIPRAEREASLEKKAEKVPTAELPPPVYATGYITAPGRGVVVTLSDGTRKTTAPGVVETVVIKGKAYELKDSSKKVSTIPVVPTTVVVHEKTNRKPSSDSGGGPRLLPKQRQVTETAQAERGGGDFGQIPADRKIRQ